VICSTASRPPFPVTLDNWQTAAQIGWTFCHIAEIFPTAIISRGYKPAAPLLRRTEPVPDLPCRDAAGVRALSARSLAATNTDGWMVVHGDRILAEHYAGAMEPATLQLLMSVSPTGTLEARLRLGAGFAAADRLRILRALSALAAPVWMGTRPGRP
jgi:hypothetical protein